MWSMTIGEIIIDSFVLLLLALTIYYCSKLNQRITEMQNNKHELLAVIRTFDEAVKTTQVNMQELKTLTRTTGSELQIQIKRAEELLGDLAFLNDAATNNANRLEKLLSNAKIAPTINHNINMPTNVANTVTPPQEPKLKSSFYNKTRDEFLNIIRKFRG